MDIGTINPNSEQFGQHCNIDWVTCDIPTWLAIGDSFCSSLTNILVLFGLGLQKTIPSSYIGSGKISATTSSVIVVFAITKQLYQQATK